MSSLALLLAAGCGSEGGAASENRPAAVRQRRIDLRALKGRAAYVGRISDGDRLPVVTFDGKGTVTLLPLVGGAEPETFTPPVSGWLVDADALIDAEHLVMSVNVCDEPTTTVDGERACAGERGSQGEIVTLDLRSHEWGTFPLPGYMSAPGVVSLDGTRAVLRGSEPAAEPVAGSPTRSVQLTWTLDLADGRLSEPAERSSPTSDLGEPVTSEARCMSAIGDSIAFSPGPSGLVARSAAAQPEFEPRPVPDSWRLEALTPTILGCFSVDTFVAVPAPADRPAQALTVYDLARDSDRGIQVGSTDGASAFVPWYGGWALVDRSGVWVNEGGSTRPVLERIDPQPSDVRSTSHGMLLIRYGHAGRLSEVAVLEKA